MTVCYKTHSQFTVLMWLDFSLLLETFPSLGSQDFTHLYISSYLPACSFCSWLISFLPQPLCVVMSQALDLGPLLLSVYIHSFVSLSIRILITLNFIFLAQIFPLNPRLIYLTAFSTSPFRCLIITSNSTCPKLSSLYPPTNLLLLQSPHLSLWNSILPLAQAKYSHHLWYFSFSCASHPIC